VGGVRRRIQSMSNQNGRLDLDKLYRAEESAEGLPALTPWDIGGPLPVAQELVAYGALRGTVLDRGTRDTTRCYASRVFPSSASTVHPRPSSAPPRTETGQPEWTRAGPIQSDRAASPASPRPPAVLGSARHSAGLIELRGALPAGRVRATPSRTCSFSPVRLSRDLAPRQPNLR
jgi:hypothetical protein